MNRHTCGVDLHLLVWRGDQLLLGLRQGTGWSDGCWHLPAGRLEAGEPATAGAAREAAEELGITIDRADLRLAHVLHHHTDTDRVALFFNVDRYAGEPANHEPDKCARLGWFDVTRLPDPMVDYARQAITDSLAGRLLTETGWEDA